MRSPFKFLDPFELADKDVFFGRDKEVDTLYRMVYQSNLILVYGYSGTGKTSLIQCGLAGRFDGPQWYPFFIRKGEDINASTRAALAEALGEEAAEEARLAELVEDVLDEYLSPVYLIFDQFEELFILGSYEEQEQFARDIQELLSQDLSCKVLFIIREEYLGELYQLEQALPRLFNFKLRVELMNKLKVQEVLRSSFAAFNIRLEEPAEERLEEIIENVSLKKAGIQLPYLQVYLDMLWREVYGKSEIGSRKSEPGSPVSSDFALPTSDFASPPSDLPSLEFTRKEIKDFGTIEAILPRFLEEQEGFIRQQLLEKYPEVAIERETIQAVLDAFVTEEGTKRPVPFEMEDDLVAIPPRLLEKFPLQNPILTACLQALEHSRILRVREGAYELAHDSLAALIDRRRTDEQRQLNEEKVRLNSIYREWQRTGQFLSRKQLTLLEPFLDRLALEPHLKQFVQDSYAHNDAVEAAERQREREELEKERRLRGEAETAKQEAEENAERAAANARQARQRTRIAVALTLLAVIALAFAVTQYQRAKLALGDALDSLLREADGHIRTLNYDAALKAIRSASELGIKQQEVAAALMEIACFRVESHHFEEGRQLTEETARLYDSTLKPGLFSSGDSLDVLRKSLQALDSNRYDSLEARYYPVMVAIEGDTFTMGCNPELDTICQNDEKLHPAGVGDFEMAATETTVWQFSIYCAAEGKDINDFIHGAWGIDGKLPVVYVDWYDALEYANWVSTQLGRDTVYAIDKLNRDTLNLADFFVNKRWTINANWNANGLRLPTETEWEYAARESGKWVRFGNGKDIAGPAEINFNPDPDYAYYSLEGNYREKTTPAGTFSPNSLGLYDMSGNLREWCWDWHGSYPDGLITDYIGPDSGRYRVLRGGSWYNYASGARVSYRSSYAPDVRSHLIGFRLARAR